MDAVGSGCTSTQALNSEVLLFGSVAVAVMTCPTGTMAAKLAVKLALPPASGGTVGVPSGVAPPPDPDAAPTGLAKSSSVKVVLGVLLSVPVTTVPAGPLLARPRTGKFCWLLGPVSASPASFGVGWLLNTSVSPWRLIPRPAFEKMAL